MKKDKKIVLRGEVPCAGPDWSTSTAYVTLTDKDVMAIGNRYLELIKEKMNDQKTTNKNKE